MKKELVMKLVHIWAEENQIELPEDVRWTGEWILDVYNFTNGDEDFQFEIKQRQNGYIIGLIPTYTVKVYAVCDALGVNQETTVYDSIICEWYDYIADNPTGIMEVFVPLSDDIQYPSSVQIKRILDTWLTENGITKDDLIRWYISTIYLPAFLDQTRKHMVRELTDGIPPFDVEDVTQYLVGEVDNGIDIHDLLGAIKKSIKKTDNK